MEARARSYDIPIKTTEELFLSDEHTVNIITQPLAGSANTVWL